MLDEDLESKIGRRKGGLYTRGLPSHVPFLAPASLESFAGTKHSGEVRGMVATS